MPMQRRIHKTFPGNEPQQWRLSGLRGNVVTVVNNTQQLVEQDTKIANNEKK
jgi:hypothetical protein